MNTQQEQFDYRDAELDPGPERIQAVAPASSLPPERAPGPSEPSWRQRALGACKHALYANPAAHPVVALLNRVLPPPRVELGHYQIVVPRLPPHLNGLRVLHVTDLHLHGRAQGAEMVPDIAAATPHNLICYTGDFIDCDEDLPRLARLLQRMPRHAPAYAVLGNHDYIPFGRGKGANDATQLCETLAAAGISVMTNRARPLFEGAIYLAGVDDPATGRDDLDRALEGLPDECVLLLAHSPDIVLRLGSHCPSLILAGHTHGGQVRLPFIGPVLTECRLPRRLIMGLHHWHGTPLFVSRGVGYSGLEIRIGCPPEIAVLTLCSPATEHQATARSEGTAPDWPDVMSPESA